MSNYLLFMFLQYGSLGHRSHVYLTTPRYLGPAMTAGAIYVASTQDDATHITCFRGNLAAHAADEGSKENLAAYAVPKTKSAQHRCFALGSYVENC